MSVVRSSVVIAAPRGERLGRGDGSAALRRVGDDPPRGCAPSRPARRAKARGWSRSCTCAARTSACAGCWSSATRRGYARWEGRGPARAQAHIEYRLTAIAEGTRFDYQNELRAPFGAVGAFASRTVIGALAQREADRSLAALRELIERSPALSATPARVRRYCPPMRRAHALLLPFALLALLALTPTAFAAAPVPTESYTTLLHQLAAKKGEPDSVIAATVDKKKHHIRVTLANNTRPLVSYPPSQDKFLIDTLLRHHIKPKYTVHEEGGAPCAPLHRGRCRRRAAADRRRRVGLHSRSPAGAGPAGR